MNKIWSENEKNFIKEHSHHMKDSIIADELSKMRGRKVSLQSVRKMRQKLGLKKVCGRGICRLEADFIVKKVEVSS